MVETKMGAGSIQRSLLVAAIVIGRNEGERLRNCLASLKDAVGLIVYVDSGSTDDSIAIACELDAEVVKLDMDKPFSAARARNAGFKRALKLDQDIRFMQFVDGDCIVQPHWIQQAECFLDNHPEYAAVCGRRREMYPENSIYNEICDIEWAVVPGDAKSCGGDVMMRTTALQDAGGYRDTLIAGEEPELCVRLRQFDWKIYVLNEEMTLHDAAILKFSQWWMRMKRGGWAYAAGNHLHGRAPEYHWIRQSIQAWIWGALPFVSTLR